MKVFNAEHGWKAKAEIRRNVLNTVGPSARVFDAFAGPGLMYREVWKDAAGYVGCDERWYRDERVCYVADNRRVMRCIDLSAFAIFDLDAFGSPWEQAMILCARRKIGPGERIGVVLTQGLAKRQQSLALLRMAGLDDALRQKVGSLHAEVVERAMMGLVKRMHGRIVKAWKATTEAQNMTYLGLVIELAEIPSSAPRDEA